MGMADKRPGHREHCVLMKGWDFTLWGTFKVKKESRLRVESESCYPESGVHMRDEGLGNRKKGMGWGHRNQG